ncbi:MAG: hypothetical protein H6Q96_600, partial [Nitrospirae bacterium]|nr:hypothetical protein [Nitrospirota bacterium]
MALAGYGLYEAIITLLSGLPLQGPAGATLRDS